MVNQPTQHSPYGWFDTKKTELAKSQLLYLSGRHFFVDLNPAARLASFMLCFGSRHLPSKRLVLPAAPSVSLHTRRHTIVLNMS